VASAAALAVAAVLLALAWPDPQRRGWALLAISGAVLYFLLRELPGLFLAGTQTGVDWNWSGHLLALAGMLALGSLMVRRAGLRPDDLGFALPSNLAPAAGIGAAALAASYFAHKLAGGRSVPIPASAWLFIAIVPGLVEEVAFRGVLLAAAERAAPAARRVAGVPVSAGAALLTAAFVVLHGFSLGMVVSVLPGALLYLWLRLATGSVLVPLVAHNLWNLIVLVAHR
jgi:membrane protease YdiL (CAAX protease family)